MAKGYSLDALVNEHYMKSRTTLETTNLDTLTGMDSVGVYYQNYDAYASTANSYPAGAQAGTLEVLPNNANKPGRVMQRYTTYGTLRCWIRSQGYATENDAFTPWKEFINASNIYNAIYPIGIVLQFDNATNPNNMFTGTVWEQITDGRSARAATSATVGTSDGKIGSLAGSDSVSISIDNLPSHTHNMRSHTHSIGSHTHTMAHTHSIDHDHGAVNTNSTGAHTHSVSGSTNTTGNHTHTIYRGNARTNGETGHTGFDNPSFDGTSGAAGNHSHTVSGTAESAGEHSHSVDLPNFTGTSGGSSAANTGGASLTTDGPNNNTSDATGGGNNLDVRNSSHYYAFWKRVA